MFQHYFPRFIQHAIPTPSIAQIQTDRQFLLAKIPVLLYCYSANLFIAGLFISCASSASITWEPIASRRTPAFSSHLFSTV